MKPSKSPIDSLEAFATFLEMTIPPRVMTFARLNGPYYCRFMNEWEFAAVVLVHMARIPREGIWKALGRFGVPLDEARLSQITQIVFL